MARAKKKQPPFMEGQMSLPKGRKVLNDKQIRKIRDDFYFGIPAMIIGQRMKVNTTTIKKCITRVTFKYHKGAEVTKSGFHSQNQQNRKAYSKAVKMYGDKPTRDQVYAIVRETESVKLAEDLASQSVLCHNCAVSNGTVPVKIIVEDKPRFEADFCAACFGKLYMRLDSFFGGYSA